METNNDAASVDPVQQQLDEAYDAETEGKLDEALHLCNEIIEAKPDLAEVYNLHGIVLEQLGRKQEAVESYDKAVKIDPDFEEAGENLSELKAEIQTNRVEEESEINYEKEFAFYVAKWGALVFGITFGVISVIDSRMEFVNYYNNLLSPDEFWAQALSREGQIQYWLNNFLENYLPVILVGLATAVLGGVSRRKPLVFGLVGSLSYAIALWIREIIVWQVIYPMIMTAEYQMSSSAVLFASLSVTLIVGFLFGAILGLVTRNWEQIGWLALTGAVGFGIQSIGFWIANNFADSSGMFEPNLTAYLITSLPEIFIDAITGAILGVLLGSVLGWFAGEEIVEEDDDALIEQSATFDQP